MPPPKSDAPTVDLPSIDEDPVAKHTNQQAGELFIVDNSDSEWTYLKKVQAPVGVKRTLKCWMELN